MDMAEKQKPAYTIKLIIRGCRDGTTTTIISTTTITTTTSLAFSTDLPTQTFISTGVN